MNKPSKSEVSHQFVQNQKKFGQLANIPFPRTLNLPGGFGVGGVGGKGVVVGTANEKRKSFLLKYHL